VIRHRWTAEDDRLIEDMAGEHRTATIAKRLGLSESQVNNRMAVLGISRKRVGVYSRNELSLILGTQDNTFLRHIVETGVIAARRIEGRGRWGQWEITERDLIAFLSEHPELFDRSRVDAAYQQFVDERWITLGEAFHRGAAHIVSLEHACLAGTIPEARKRGVRWVVPEPILPRLIEGRRRWTPDTEHRLQVRMYDRLQARHQLTGKRHRRPRRAA